jgi:hypothetical protein
MSRFHGCDRELYCASAVQSRNVVARLFSGWGGGGTVDLAKSSPLKLLYGV